MCTPEQLFWSEGGSLCLVRRCGAASEGVADVTDPGIKNFKPKPEGVAD